MPLCRRHQGEEQGKSEGQRISWEHWQVGGSPQRRGFLGGSRDFCCRGAGSGVLFLSGGAVVVVVVVFGG